MKKYTRFSPHTSLAALGIFLHKGGIWEIVETQVHVQEKTIKHRPVDWFQDGFHKAGKIELNERDYPYGSA